MSTSALRQDRRRWPLVVLLLLIAFNAWGGGYYGLSGAAGVPTTWLEGTPFQSYFWPSLILLLVVGGTMAGAALSVARGQPQAFWWSTMAAVVLLGWIATQLAMIGYVSWLQPAMVVAALLIAGFTAWLARSRSR
jgi:hypothetical protein